MSDPAVPVVEPLGESPDGVESGLTDAIALGVSAVAQAVLAVLCVRELQSFTSSSTYASYSMFLAVTGVAIVAMNWPAWSVLRLGSEEMAERGRLGRTAFLHFALLASSCAVVAPAIFVARRQVEALIGAPVVSLVLGYAATTALSQVVAAHLKPAGRVALFGGLQILTRALYLALLLYWPKPLLARDVALIITITATPQIAIALAVLVGRLRGPYGPRPGDVRRAVGFGVPILARQLGLVVLQYANLFVIRLTIREDAEIDHYQVAAQVAEQTAMLAIVAEHLVGPILARAAAVGDERKLATYYRVLAPQVVLAWGVAIACGILLAHVVCGALHAHDVEASARTLKVLFLATGLRIVSTLEAPVLDAHLESRAPLASFFVRLATNVFMAIALVPRIGIGGAAWATVAAALLGGLAQTVYVAKRFALPATRLYLYLAPAVVAFVWDRAFGGDTWRDAGVALAIVVATFVLARALGVFSPKTVEAIGGVRMPAALRRIVVRFYGADAP